MKLRRTMISLGSVIVLALGGVTACTRQESGTAVPSSPEDGSSGLSVPTEPTSPDDTGSSDQGPSELNPTGQSPSASTDTAIPDTGELSAPATATAPEPGTGTGTAQSTSAWSGGPNKAGGAPAPVFPDSLPGWRLNNSWDATTRATVADWAPARGPDNGDFPTTVNGCEVQRFLVRWRANDDQARLEARWINAAGTPGQSVSGHAGWFDLDGCTTPQFRFITSDGVATRSSVSVSVQQYFPQQ